MKKTLGRAGAAGVVAVVIGGIALSGSAQAAAGGRVTICHRTHSVTNPYRMITVSQSAVMSGAQERNHTHHTGPAYVVGYDYPPHAKVWGDVIPENGRTLAQMLGGAPCVAFTAAEFYNVEREVGVPRGDILADLSTQGAEADAAITDFTVLRYTGTSDDPALQAEKNGEVVPAPGDAPAGTTDHDHATDGGTSTDGGATSDGGATTDGEAPSGGTSTDGEAPTDGTDGPATDGTATDGTATDGTATPPTQQLIRGKVWLDLDRDGVQGPRERGVPGARVSLLRVTAAAPVTLAVRRPAGRFAAGEPRSTVLATAGTEEVGAAPTDGDGHYWFTDLEPGDYRVVAQHPDDLAVTYDGDETLDARRDMALPAGGTEQADVGLVGGAAVDTAVRTATGQPVPDGDVTVRWAGVDTAIATADDVLLPATVEDGRLRVTGLPAGDYRVEGSSTRSVVLALAAGDTATEPLTLTDDASTDPGPDGTTTGPVGPSPTDPAPSDPAPTDPAPTDPAPTDPTPTDPTPTDPTPTGPTPTAPAPPGPVGPAPAAPVGPVPLVPLPTSPVTPVSRPVPPAAAVTAAGPTVTRLSRTGASPAPLVAVSLGLLGGGAALLVARRRVAAR